MDNKSIYFHQNKSSLLVTIVLFKVIIY